MKWQNHRVGLGFVELVCVWGGGHQEMGWSLGSIQISLDIFIWES